MEKTLTLTLVLNPFLEVRSCRNAVLLDPPTMTPQYKVISRVLQLSSSSTPPPLLLLLFCCCYAVMLHSKTFLSHSTNFSGLAAYLPNYSICHWLTIKILGPTETWCPGFVQACYVAF
jgi:hypothetical protein